MPYELQVFFSSVFPSIIIIGLSRNFYFHFFMWSRLVVFSLWGLCHGEKGGLHANIIRLYTHALFSSGT